MPLVVDASVAICWLMPDERHPVAESAWLRITTDTALVPSLWWFETRNILLVNERRGRLNNAKTVQALTLLGRLPFAVDTSIDERLLLRLARTHNLTVYDAAYLELAQRRRCDLATLDRALVVAANAEAVPVVLGGPA